MFVDAGAERDIRKQILRVARTQFLKKGYLKTSMREIAGEAGVGVGNPGEYTDTDMCAGDTIFGEHEALIARVPHLLESTQRTIDEGRVHPMVLAARFHGFFEYLHPFRDGNGRIGRLFSNFILHKAGHPIVIIRQENKEEYLHALRCIRTEGTDEHLVAFFFRTAIERMHREMEEKKLLSTSCRRG